jgi:hypothetical protein
MLVKYTPENEAEAREWDFDPNRIRQSDAEIIEKRYGQNWTKFVDAIQAGNAQARRVLLWHLMRKEHHTLRFEDTPDFFMGEVEIDYSLADLQKLRGQIVAAPVPDEEKQQILDRIDLEIGQRLGKEELAPEDLGKAPSNSES